MKTIGLCMIVKNEIEVILRCLESAHLIGDYGYCHQEMFVSLYQAANLEADLAYDADDVLATYSRAHDVRKDRAEALHAAARYCRVKERFERGYKFAQRALGMKSPRDGLFLEQWIYDYGVLDEYAATAY
jgi:hypothetical protein